MGASDEMYFQENVDKLACSCCASNNEDKIELYKLFPSGYRVFCTECCAVADGDTVEDAVNNFYIGGFHLQPLTA